MKHVSTFRLQSLIALCSTLFFVSLCQAQPGKNIDWSKDTVSKADAIGGKNTYLNTVRGSGQNATEKVVIPVSKLKDIMDACAANNVQDVSVLIVTIRQADIARYRRNHPGYSGSDNQLKGSQTIVFRVPRRAFGANAGGRIMIPANNKLMLSFLSAGFVQLNSPYADLPFADDDVFFDVGEICPPPGSCGD